jgi:hypothetical protein
MRAVPAVLVALVVLAVSGCSGGEATGEVTPVPSPVVVTPLPTPSTSPDPTPQEEFALEVEELYALVKDAVEGSPDYASSGEVLSAFATTVALVRVEPEQTADRQRVVDAAEAAAESYRIAAGITGGVERAAAGRQAVVRLRELERVIRMLPTESPSPTPSPVGS